MNEQKKDKELPLLEGIPPVGERKVSIHITLSAQRKLRAGHPWLFETAINKQSHEGKPGDLAVIYDRKSKFLAIGLYDPTSGIRVRLLQFRKPAAIDGGWFGERIAAAAEIRKSLTGKGTNGYRLIHGEDDGLPGLVADRYGDSLVLKIYTPAWIPHLATVTEEILKLMPLKRIVLRMSRNCMESREHLHRLTDGQTIYGNPPAGPVLFMENRITFEADLIKGQKTGFFLDQRENRERVEKLAKGKDVLNVFSYSGGFSLYAARGGAKSVTSVDISPYAIESISRNVSHNDDKAITGCEYEGIAEDGFSAMERLERQNRRYGLVVIDPPSFAKKGSDVESALKAYGKLAILGMKLLKKEGILVMASCSSRVRQEEFFKAVFDAAAAMGKDMRELERTAHAIDHPCTMKETSYLKCLYLQPV